jgi:transposase
MRPLTLRHMRRSERRILRAKLRNPTLPVRLHHRYRIIAEAARGHAGPLIADRVGCDVDTVYVWVHRFNTSGFDTFKRPPTPKGREPILTSAQVRALVAVALSCPADLGLPFTEWSTATLAAYCRARGVLPAIADEWARRVLRREGITPQWLKTWKQSPDLAFEAKKRKRASSASTSAGPEAERRSASTNDSATALRETGTAGARAGPEGTHLPGKD